MPAEKKSGTFKHIEIIAYILAIWSFLVLFLESIFEYYTGAYQTIEFVTAVANLILLVLTILSRVLSGEVKKSKTVVYFDLAMLILGSLLLTYQTKFVIFFLLIRQTWFIVQYILFRAFEGKIYKLLMRNPPVSLMLSFAGVILIGTILLMLPVSSAEKNITNFVDALFTATSATCVTGLIVVDTGTYYSLFGQIVILLLIQIGGLGIMTISTAFALMLGQRISLNVQTLMHKVVGETPVIDVLKLLRATVLVTGIIEFMGAIFLFSGFAKIMPVAKAIYYALFHSVSAFCNAGFDILGTADNAFPSLTGYSGNILINVVIMLLIITGGIGFLTWDDIYRNKMNFKRYRMQSKIILMTTVCLIIFPAVFFFACDLKNLPAGERLLAAMFQSVTTRTAGFNTIDISEMSEASKAVMILLMLIGGSPGSTAGGMKTTTFTVLILNAIATFRSQENAGAFGRRLEYHVIKNAATIAMLYFTLFFCGGVAISVYEGLPLLDCLYEAASAVGTVGLTLGVTPGLHVFSQVVLIILMYLGRVGGLTLIYAVFSGRNKGNAKLPLEKITVG